MDTLCSLEIYFSNEVRLSIHEFIRWDEACGALRVNELPSRDEYSRKRQLVLAAVHKELAR